MRTAEGPAQISLLPDRAELAADGYDLSYITVEALDSNDTLCPLADNLISFEIDGPSEIAGVGNGNQLSFEPFQANYRELFFGKAMLIIRSKNDERGSITVTATGDDLEPVIVRLQSI